jgi:hypothetical protein
VIAARSAAAHPAARLRAARSRRAPARDTRGRLVPDPASADARRARLDRKHPTSSRWIGRFSLIMLLIGAGILALQIIEPVSRIPPVAARIGSFESPIHLPLWLNITLGLAAAAASTERALRLRYNWRLDGAAN